MGGFFLTGQGGGGVQLPIDANQVNYNNNLVDLQAPTVQDAIEKLKKLIDSKIHIVQDNTELQALLVAGEVDNEDIIYVIDSTDVTDHDGSPVSIKNTSVAMIYDNTKGWQNNIKLFARCKEVEDWQDLSYTDQYDYVNLLDTEKKVTGLYYDNASDKNKLSHNNDWNIVDVHVEAGKQYTIIRPTRTGAEWKRVAYIQEDGTVTGVDELQETQIGALYKFVTPIIQADTEKIGISLHDDDIDRCMIFEGDVAYTGDYIPYINGVSKVNVWEEVSLSFDKSGTTIVSDLLDEAVKEISEEYVSEFKDDVLKGKIVLHNGYILGEPLSFIDPIYKDDEHGGMGENGFAVHEKIKAPANTNVTRLVVGMHEDSVQIGDVVKEIFVGVKAEQTDTVGEYILENYSTRVVENPIVDAQSDKTLYPISSSKVVVIPIERAFTHDAPFILSIPKMHWGRRADLSEPNTSGFYGAGSPRPLKGETFTYTQNSGNYIGEVVVYGDDVPIGKGNGYVSSEYRDDTSELVLIKEDGSEDKYKLAHLEKDNIFKAKNTFNTIHLGGVGTAVPAEGVANNNKNPIALPDMKWGIRTLSSHSENNGLGYVKSLQMAVRLNKNENELFEVSVWEVKKGNDRNSDVPTLIADRVQLPVIEETNWFGNHNKYVEYKINRHYDNDTYFIYSFARADVGTRYDRTANLSDDYIRIEQNVEVSQESIKNAAQHQSMGVHKLVLGDVDITEMIDHSYVDSDYDTKTGQLTFLKHNGDTKTHTIAVGGAGGIGTVTHVFGTAPAKGGNVSMPTMPTQELDRGEITFSLGDQPNFLVIESTTQEDVNRIKTIFDN